jgi:hypothetical protein
MNDSTHTPDAERALTAPLDAYEAQSARYDRLEDETTTRNKAAVVAFDPYPRSAEAAACADR